MADRYWVGGTGTWTGTNTGNWSAATGKSITASCAATTLTVTAGTVLVGDTVWSNNHTSLGTITANLGGGNYTVSIGGTFASQAMSAALVGVPVPTSNDNVFFDANSNSGTTAFTVTMQGSRVCNDFTASGLDGVMTLGGAPSAFSVNGSLSFPATNFTPTYTSSTNFTSPTTGKTITTNGVAFPTSVSFSGVGGGWQLQDALTVPSASSVTFTNGALDLNNKTLTCGTFSSTNSNTRSIAFGSTGSIVLTTTTAGSTVLNMANVNGFSFTGTSNISAAMSVTRTFNFGGTSGSNPTRVLNINLTSGASVPTFTGFFRQIDFTGSTFSPGLVTIDCHGFTLASGGSYAITTFNLSFGGACTFTGKQISALTIDNLGSTTTLLDAGSVGGTTTLTQGTLDLTNVTLTTNSFSSDNSNTRSIAFGTTGSIVVTGTTTALAMATATGFTFTGTSNISAAMSTGRTFNFGGTAGATTSNRLNVNLTSGSSVPTFTGSFRQINFTGTTITYGGAANCHGFTLASGGTYTSASFITVGDGTLTYTGKSVGAININAAGITTTLADAGSNTTTTLTQGTLGLNNQTLSTSTFSSSNSNTRVIAFGTGQITLTGNATTVWNTATTTGFSSTGTFLVVSNYSGSSGLRTFSLGGLAVDFKAGAASGGISFGTAGTDTVSVTGTAIKDLDTSGFTGIFGSATRTLTGNLTIGSGTTMGVGSGSSTTFGATSGTQLITTNGKSLDFPIIFNGAGGTFSLQDAMTVGSARTTTLTNGTLNLNNQTLTTGLFSSSNSNIRTIAFGTGTISCSGTGTVWNTGTSSNLTTTGTQVVNVISSGSIAIVVSPGTLSEANSISFNFTGGTYGLTFLGTAGHTARNVNFTGYAGTLGTVSAVTIFGNLTLSTGMSLTASSNVLTFGATSGTQLITTNGKTIDFPITFNGVGGTFSLQDAITVGSTRTTTLTNGTLNINNQTLTTGSFTSAGSNTRTIAFGTGNISCSGTGTVWNTSTTTNLTTTGTQVVNVTSSGSIAILVYSGSLSEANSISFNFTGGTYAATFNYVSELPTVRNLNFTGFSGTFSLDVGANTTVYGNLNISTGMGIASSTATMTFGATSGTQQLTTNGKILDFPITFNGVGGTFRLEDAFTMGALDLTLTNGTLNLNGKTLTAGTATTASGTKNLTFNGGTLVITGIVGSTGWNNAAPTNFTTTAGTGIGTISLTNSGTKQFVGGGSTYDCTLNQGGAGTLIITGANTFNDITNTNATASQITFPASTTTTVNAFTLAGSSGNLVSLRSSTGGTRFTLSKSSGTVSVSFLNIQDSTATGGATWEAFTSNGNIDSGNNLGWSFGIASGANFFLLFA